MVPVRTYRGLQPIDPELQLRHAERNRILAETLTIREAAQRYGVSEHMLLRRLDAVGCVPIELGARRWSIVDIERVLERSL